MTLWAKVQGLAEGEGGEQKWRMRESWGDESNTYEPKDVGSFSSLRALQKK